MTERYSRDLHMLLELELQRVECHQDGGMQLHTFPPC